MDLFNVGDPKEITSVRIVSKEGKNQGVSKIWKRLGDMAREISHIYAVL